MSSPVELTPRHFAPRALVLLVLACPLPAGDAAAGGSARKVLLIAGPITGHPKDTHEYERSVTLLAHLLDTSPNLKGLRAEARFGWPEDPALLDGADAIVLISDGSDRKETDHPLYAATERWPELEKRLRRGCGLVDIHWTTFHPARFHDTVTEWLGGYFDYETGTGDPKWYSRIEHGTWDVALPSPDHPIARGVKPFRVKEEFYYRLRFRDGDTRLRPIAAIGEPLLEKTVGWAIERADGGRSFGFTGGHWFENWWNLDFRRLVLNAIAWTAGAEVPAGGVDSDPADPYRVLILTGHNSPHHDWRATTGALVHAIEQDPRARVEVSEDIEDLASPGIRDHAALVLNYSNWERPGLSEAAKRGLTGYLGGGGLTVIHFANGAFNATLPERQDTDWEEFRTRIVRRAWMHGENRSGHDAYGPFRVEIAAAAHPITAGLAPFDTEDELYFRQEGPLPIEPLVTARSKVTGRDEPLAWAYDYKKGRVFQTVLGHSDLSVRRAAMLIRRGTAWAAVRPALSLDPPARAIDRAFFRDGSPWTPEKSMERGRDAKAPKKTGAVLPPNPGIDGGAGGHWGLKDDRDWIDDRVRRMDTGPFWSSSLDTPSGLVAKAVSVRLDGGGACFDADELSLRAGWTGGFLALSPARFGLIERPRIDGQIAFSAPRGPGWEGGRSRYRGLHRHGTRVAFSYQVGETDVLDAPALEAAAAGAVFTRSIEVGPGREALALNLLGADGWGATIDEIAGVPLAWNERKGTVTAAALRIGPGSAGARPRWSFRRSDGVRRIVLEIPARGAPLPLEVSIWTGPAKKLLAFAEAVARRPPPEGPRALLDPGVPLWPERLRARGSVSTKDDPYVIDTIPVPHENPWRALMFPSGHDFLPDGRAAVATVHGDVWLVSGIDEKLEDVAWKRFASGLYQPLGLKVAGGKVHVLGRDRITVLHDRNDDGEADFLESLTNDFETSPEGHEYHTCLEADADGNFYYASPRGLHRVSPDGTRHETIATGFRFPNGIGVGPGGVITVAPQEGEWTPASQICEVRAGGHYGHGGPRPGPDRPLGRDPPLCYIPRHADNSTGGQVWAPEGWGPLGGRLLALSFGRSTVLLVLRDTAGDPPQGAAVPLGLRFLSGAMRGRFHPKDGHLYVTGLLGWVTNAISDGSFQRVRWTGKRAAMPAGFEARANGILLTFSEPLDRETAEDPGSYAVRRWNYRYSADYGSEEYSAARPDVAGHDAVKVLSATLLDGGKGVFIEIPRLQPVMQMHITASLAAAGGEDIAWDIYPTIHRLGPSFDLDEEDAEEPAEESKAPAASRGLALTLTSLASGHEDARVARLAAISVPSGTSPGAFLEPGPFRALWTGRLVLEERSRVRFSAEGRGRVRLAIDGNVVLEGEGEDLSRLEGVLARLPRGERELALEYHSPRSGDAWFRLAWEGRNFARETVPPTAFRRHPASEPGILAEGLLRRRGREIAAAKGCIRCHAGRGSAAPRPSALGPSPPIFDGIGARLREEWTARWIGEVSLAEGKAASCLAGRAASGTGTGTGTGDPRAWDLAAYLAGLGGGEEAAEDRVETPAEDVLGGGRLFARLGCIACHTLPDAPPEEDAHARVPLRDAARKWRPRGLREYLESPGRHRPAARMPDFKLSREEAGSLAAFIISRAAQRAGGAGGSRGDAERGEKLAAELGCLGCHDISSATGAPGAPPLDRVESADWRRSGCAAEGGPTGRAPNLGLRAEDREALRTLGAAGLRTPDRDCALEESEDLIRALRCAACHERDGEPSTWSLVAAEVESLAAPEPPAVAVQSRPALTFTGEQIEEAWLRDLLAGRLVHATRPWLEARMPAFPAGAAAIARGLASGHGIAPRDASAEIVSSPDAPIGRRLIGAASGFSCITCHPVGSEPALMTHHFGAINLVHSRARLRPEFYLRWMRNPQRIAPLTAMPAYADASGSATPLAEVLGGDAARQFEAIWHYLGTVR